MKYIVVFFPYPSNAKLHAGHYYNYAVMDSYCRWMRRKGEEVFQPFGYDAFGLPAELYAKKIGGDPRIVTADNIEKFRIQMESMNTQYEEILTTCSPEYINKTQAVFKLMYERNLAYKAEAEVDWCSSCETTLAKEQVQGGKCERCSTISERKVLNQWFFKITDYKQRLIDGLADLDWPESTKKAQYNWLQNQHDWNVSRQRAWGCPIPIEGETDTLDTFVDSSFYFVEYCLMKGIKPVPVDLYVGGSEHACMHLIYARFVTMVMYDAGLIDFQEPFTKLIHQGMILKDGQKMSKSKNNTVNLDEYSQDEVRFYLMFMGHYFDGGSWSDESIMGIRRFINRMQSWLSNEGTDEIDFESFETKVYNYTEAFKFNKVVSEFMILNKQNKHKALTKDCSTKIVELLKVYMPGFKIERPQ